MTLCFICHHDFFTAHVLYEVEQTHLEKNAMCRKKNQGSTN